MYPADSRILGRPADELRRTRTSVKWRAHPVDVLPAWIAELDCDPCPAVVDAVTRAVSQGDTGYAWTVPYAEAFADLAAAQWSWTVDPRRVVCVADVLTGIARLLEVVTDPGGAVVVSSPVYHSFFTVIDAVGRQAVDAPLTPEGRLDPAVLAETFARVTAGGQRAAYLLCNPHNPSGTVHSPAELAMVADLARAHDVQVVSDEIHAPLVLPGARHTPYVTVPGAEGGIAVTSASKAWNLSGLKSAVVVPGDDALAQVRRLHPFVGYGASHLGAIAQTAAWNDGREWLARLVGELDANRSLLETLVREQLPGARLLRPEATYLAWLDCRDLGLGDDPAAHFREHGSVALSDGPSFGASGAGHVRLNYGTSPENLTEVVGRMASSLV